MTKTTSSPKARLTPVCIRLNASEVAKLRKLADDQNLSVSAYIRACLFSDENYKSDLLPLETRQKLLAQILAQLGKAEYSKSLRGISEAAQAGTLTLTPDVEQQILDGSNHIKNINGVLLRALGLRLDQNP